MPETPTEYYTSRYSGEEIDRGIDGALQLGGATTKQQALHNIGGRPNRNLLDNWYFVGGGSQQGGGQFPINQRGQTSYTGNSYSLDQWVLTNANMSLTVNNGYITVVHTGSEIREFHQRVPLEKIQGGTYTFSLLTLDGNLYSVTGIVNPDSEQINLYTALPSGGQIGIRMTTAQKADGYLVTRWLSPVIDGSIQLIAAKLELGPTQTLAYQDEDGNWQLFETPDYGEELAKCQRYFYKYVGNIFLCNYATGEGYALFEFPVEMRITPTVTIDSYNPDWGVPDARGINSHGLVFHSTSNGGIVTQFTASAEL